MSHPRAFTMFELLVCTAIIAILASILLPAVQMTREMARRTQCTNNLFQLGTALANYHDAHRTFPPGYVSALGPAGEELGPGWAWGAMLLPMLEQGELYQQLRFNEPSDSNWNADFAGKSLEVFICPSSNYGGFNYVACFGRGDMLKSPESGDGVFFRNSRVRQRDIDDGGMTILLGERGGLFSINYVGYAEWASVIESMTPGLSSPRPRRPGAPPPINLDPSRVLGHTGFPDDATFHPPNARINCDAGFGSMHAGGGANFVFVDGSVRFIANHVNPHVFAALATRAGGEMVTDRDF